jgi:hypothetical protein
MKDAPFYLVVRGEFYGIFSTVHGTVEIISRDKRIAEAFLKKMLQSEKPHYKKPLDQVLESMVDKQDAAPNKESGISQ